MGMISVKKKKKICPFLEQNFHQRHAFVFPEEKWWVQEYGSRGLGPSCQGQKDAGG